MKAVRVRLYQSAGLVLYCAALIPIEPLGAALLLILGLHLRARRGGFCALAPGVLVSYLYLLYAFIRLDPATACAHLSLLAGVNALALCARRCHDTVVVWLQRRLAARRWPRLPRRVERVCDDNRACDQEGLARARRSGGTPA